jgi:hypothetical protein
MGTKKHPVHIVRVEFNLNGLLNNVIEVSGLCNEDGSIVQLNSLPLAQ